MPDFSDNLWYVLIDKDLGSLAAKDKKWQIREKN